MNGALLEVDAVTKRFGATQALASVDFELKAGELHSLVGENGAGKSTLIKILGGVHERDSGSIRISGQPVSLRGPRDAQEAGIIVIPQEMQLVPTGSVADNVCLGDWPQKSVLGILPVLDRKTACERTREACSRFDFDIDPETPVDRLSFAERQLVVIARALLRRARILILDEPTASLEHREAERLFSVLSSLKRDGVGIVYVSHFLEEIAAISDRCTVMRDGQVVHVCRRGEFEPNDLIRHMTGRDLDELRHPHTSSPGAVLVEVDDAAGPIELRRGEAAGLAGLLGSGTSQLLLRLYGAADEPTRLRMNGRDVTLRSPADAIAHGIGLVPGERRLGLIADLSVRDNIALPNLDKLGSLFRLDTGQIDRLVDELVVSLDIRPRDSSVPVGTLSGGNQQKVIFARWLASNVDLLLLDEPTQGIDVGAKARIHRLMREFVEDGKAVLFASSESVELLNMSDNFRVMSDGRITERIERGSKDYNEGALRTALGG